MLIRMKFAQLLILLLMTINCRAQASMFGWLWGKRTDETTVLVADGIPLVSIPYESMTEDEKFLQEAAKFTEIDPSVVAFGNMPAQSHYEDSNFLL